MALFGLGQDFQGGGCATDHGAGPGRERIGVHFTVRRAVSDLRDSWGIEVGPHADKACPYTRQMFAPILLSPAPDFRSNALAPANLVPLPNRNLSQRPRMAGPADG